MRKVADLRREHVRRIDRPSFVNDALKKLRILLKFALDLGWRRNDPTLHVKKFAEGEHLTWSDEEVAAYEARWPIGTMQRTVFALLLYTGQRVSDVAAMSWKDVSADGAWTRVVQEKTSTKLDINLHPELLEVLRAWPTRLRAIVETKYGKPFTAKGLDNKMADMFDAAGLPDECVTHGLRNAAARRLAGAGCSTHEIASVTGHKSLAEIERDTRAANQRRLSEMANSRVKLRPVPTRLPDNTRTGDEAE